MLYEDSVDLYSHSMDPKHFLPTRVRVVNNSRRFALILILFLRYVEDDPIKNVSARGGILLIL